MSTRKRAHCNSAQIVLFPTVEASPLRESNKTPFARGRQNQRLPRKEEPTTEDLLRDYKLQNDLVLALQPRTAFLKWRYPFPDKKEFSFSRVSSNTEEEQLQAFAKVSSSELRLFLKGPVYKLKTVTYADMISAEKRMAAYTAKERYNPRIIKEEDMLISGCRCNDCSLLNMLASDCKKKGIKFNTQVINSSCGL